MDALWKLTRTLHWVLAHSLPGLSEERMLRYLAKVQAGEPLTGDELAGVESLRQALLRQRHGQPWETPAD